MISRRLMKILFSVITTSSLLVGCGGERGTVCSANACGPALRIDVVGHPALTPEASFLVEITAGGITNVCTVRLTERGDAPIYCTAPLHSSLAAFGAAPDGGGARLEAIEVTDAAQTVSVRIERRGAVVAEQTFAPSYTRNGINAPDCGPVCVNATASITLTDPGE